MSKRRDGVSALPALSARRTWPVARRPEPLKAQMKTDSVTLKSPRRGRFPKNGVPCIERRFSCSLSSDLISMLSSCVWVQLADVSDGRETLSGADVNYQPETSSSALQFGIPVASEGIIVPFSCHVLLHPYVF